MLSIYINVNDTRVKLSSDKKLEGCKQYIYLFLSEVTYII